MNVLSANACLLHPCVVCRAHTERRCFRPFRRACPVKRALRKPICALVAERGQTVDSLKKWFRDNKVDLQSCKLNLEHGQPTLSASTGVQAGQTLLSVSQSEWVTVDLVGRSPIGPAVSHLDGWLQLALYILYSRQQTNSGASDYALSLPESLNVPLLWTDAQLSLLEGTQILSTLEGYRYSTAC